jgi:membrane-bound lytic murein transglycosylase F
MNYLARVFNKSEKSSRFFRLYSMNRGFGHFFGLTLVSVFFTFCSSQEPEFSLYEDLATITSIPTNVETTGSLVALVDNSISSYYIFKGQPRGFEYELLKWFCKDHDLRLEVKVMPTFDHAIDSLLVGAGDLVAANLTITGERSRKLQFTPWLMRTRQMLVQRYPENHLNLSRKKLDDLMVNEALELEGKTVHVHRKSAFYDRLVHLDNENGLGINIKILSDDVDVEEMIEMVSKGQIDYTVVDENISHLFKHLYPNLDFNTPISLRQSIGWATRNESDSLQALLDAWILQNRSSTKFAVIYNKYFKPTRSKIRDMQSQFNLSRGGAISPFDDNFRKAGEKFSIDWKLLAALSYQESLFNPEAISPFGAMGLMQVLPNTASRFGVNETQLLHPESNIMAGAAFLRYLFDFWDKKLDDENEVIKFSLASYNAGLGHVQDAIRLAEVYELDTATWDGNVAVMLRKKSQPKYYQHPVVRHGFCRGNEPFRYVENVMGYYRQYVMVGAPRGEHVAGP